MCIYAQLKPLYNIVLKNKKRGKFSIKKYFKKKKKENFQIYVFTFDNGMKSTIYTLHFV